MARSISDFIGCIADECTGSSFIGGATPVRPKVGKVASPPTKTQASAGAQTLPLTKQYALPSAQVDSLHIRLSHAEIVLQTLTHVFGGNADTDNPGSVPGLHGVVQNAQWLLGGLHQEIMEIDGDLPSDLRWRTLEASNLIDLIEHLEFNGGFKFNRWHEHWTCGYFDAALYAVTTAKAALEQMERIYG